MLTILVTRMNAPQMSIADVIDKQSTLIFDRIDSNRTIDLNVPYDFWQIILILIPTQEVIITIGDTSYELRRGIYYVAIRSIAGTIIQSAYEIISVSGDNLDELTEGQKVDLCVQRCLRCDILFRSKDPIERAAVFIIPGEGVIVTGSLCRSQCDKIPTTSGPCANEPPPIKN